jgi:hypothetical protein
MPLPGKLACEIALRASRAEALQFPLSILRLAAATGVVLAALVMRNAPAASGVELPQIPHRNDAGIDPLRGKQQKRK